MQRTPTAIRRTRFSDVGATSNVSATEPEYADGPNICSGTKTGEMDDRISDDARDADWSRDFDATLEIQSKLGKQTLFSYEYGHARCWISLGHGTNLERSQEISSNDRNPVSKDSFTACFGQNVSE